MMLSALLGLISLGFLASSSSALLLPLTRSQVAFRPACGAHRAPAAFTMSAETVEAAEDALAKATATEAKAVSELAAAIAADDDTVGCIVDAENADVRRRAPRNKARLGLGLALGLGLGSAARARAWCTACARARCAARSRTLRVCPGARRVCQPGHRLHAGGEWRRMG